MKTVSMAALGAVFLILGGCSTEDIADYRERVSATGEAYRATKEEICNSTSEDGQAEFRKRVYGDDSKRIICPED